MCTCWRQRAKAGPFATAELQRVAIEIWNDRGVGLWLDSARGRKRGAATSATCFSLSFATLPEYRTKIAHLFITKQSKPISPDHKFRCRAMPMRSGTPSSLAGPRQSPGLLATHARAWRPTAPARRAPAPRRPMRAAAAVAAPPPTGTRTKPRIALTCGDPAGIGPEVSSEPEALEPAQSSPKARAPPCRTVRVPVPLCSQTPSSTLAPPRRRRRHPPRQVVLKAVSDPSISDAADVTVFGAPELLRRSHAELRLALGAQRRPADWLPDPDTLKLRPVSLAPWVAPGVVPHLGTKASGEASFRFLEAAITETLAGGWGRDGSGPRQSGCGCGRPTRRAAGRRKPCAALDGPAARCLPPLVALQPLHGPCPGRDPLSTCPPNPPGHYDAIVTAPVSKMAWHAAGHTYPGQTEYLAERAGAEAGTYGMVGG
jgi:hypothetical protein